ncbi:predicted protein [Verticillium alfalfae VaMs.102]|uniref:Predicted protein n=1 Tax=Verticillium alfalfae (strain VaMs.102 / ATCC MYA-4576 / FGSC 10136) TaxID=526221 RepID=C9S9Z1_VERA1|nr:predicted protein [Verticillium alfalfae VaMs.102]EEY16204.1 predicted protein [Verticillium alfalfae VaMs.102]
MAKEEEIGSRAEWGAGALEGPSLLPVRTALAARAALSHLETPVRRVHGDVMPRRHQDNTTRSVLCARCSVLRSQFLMGAGSWELRAEASIVYCHGHTYEAAWKDHPLTCRVWPRTPVPHCQRWDEPRECLTVGHLHCAFLLCTASMVQGESAR